MKKACRNNYFGSPSSVREERGDRMECEFAEEARRLTQEPVSHMWLLGPAKHAHTGQLCVAATEARGVPSGTEAFGRGGRHARQRFALPQPAPHRAAGPPGPPHRHNLREFLVAKEGEHACRTGSRPASTAPEPSTCAAHLHNWACRCEQRSLSLDCCLSEQSGREKRARLCICGCVGRRAALANVISYSSLKGQPEQPPPPTHQL